jgi:hypothetical protein
MEEHTVILRGVFNAFIHGRASKKNIPIAWNLTLPLPFGVDILYNYIVTII